MVWRTKTQSDAAILLGAGCCDYSQVHPMWHVTPCACRRAETWISAGMCPLGGGSREDGYK